MSVRDLTLVAGGRRHRTPSELMLSQKRPWGHAVADDEDLGFQEVNKFGRNEACSTGEVIRAGGGTIDIETTATKVEIIGTDGGDIDAGAGAQAVKILGVDINWNPIEEQIATNGLSASLASELEYLYVYRAKVMNSGAVRNLGDLNIRRQSAGAVLAIIPQGYGQTQQAVMTVFHGCDFHVNTLRFEGSKTGALTGEIALVEYDLDEGIRIVHPIVFSSAQPITVEWTDAPKVFTEKTLLWVEAVSLSAGAIITASFDGVMERHEDSTV